MSVNPNFFEDCERARPDWSPEDGVASSFSEFLIVMNGPLGYVWLAVLALFLWKRSALTGVLLSLLSVLILAYWNWETYNYDLLYFGQFGGCVGSLVVTNVVFLAAVILGLSTALWRRFRRR